MAVERWQTASEKNELVRPPLAVPRRPPPLGLLRQYKGFLIIKSNRRWGHLSWGKKDDDDGEGLSNILKRLSVNSAKQLGGVRAGFWREELGLHHDLRFLSKGWTSVKLVGGGQKDG